MKNKFLFFPVLASILLAGISNNLFSAVTLKDCSDKGGEAVEERGVLKCSGGDYDEEPILTPELEENPEIAPPASEVPKEAK